MSDPSELEAFGRAAEMLQNRIRKNERRLRKWRKREAVTCYRVYDADIPEVPLAVDLYETVAPAVETHLAVSVYQRRSLPEGPTLQRWLDAMCEAAAAATGTLPDRVHCRQRERQRGSSQYERQSVTGARHQVMESGLRFWVAFEQYLDTGLFLDHRPTRAEVRTLSAGKRVLNLFAYTGAFSVYAAAGGASRTTTVDLSNTYLQWAGDNLELNGYASGAHRCVRADVMEWVHRDRGQYDLIVCDPPTFSNSKKTRDVFDVQRDHAALLSAIERRLSPDGIVWFSTNFRRFKPDPGTLGYFEETSTRSVPPDFRNRRIHRCWRFDRARKTS